MDVSVSDHSMAGVTVGPSTGPGTGHATSTPDRGIAAESSADARQSQAILSSKSLTAAMAKVGTCGLSATSVAYIISATGSSPAIYRPGVSASATRVCPDIKAVADVTNTSSAITSMWAWGNPVPASVDARGLGEPAFVPAAISAFSAAKHLTDVRLSVPWAADTGSQVRAWLAGSVSAIHTSGQTVSALGGDNGWVAQPALAVQWMTAAHSVAPFNGVQLDVEPWTDDAGWVNHPAAIASYIALVQQSETAAHALGMKLGLDVPWWLSTTPYGSGSVLSALLPFIDSVSIVAYSDHAGSSDGIIAQAWPAVVETTAARVPFTIGVQTSSDAISGGAQYTFADKGSAILETETAKVRAAYSTTLGYSGVTVEEYLSWSTLKP